jgi:UDP-N-acetylglucosamine 2-epimerase (non-hydrolysing)
MLRKVTDRREAVDAGAAILVGVDPQVIITAATELMENEALYSRMAQHRKLFGDGLAARRIANVLQARHAAVTIRRPMAIVTGAPTRAVA